jgi:UDP-GlcNAc:undecaprenyl-phosphate GlcNAc-1-phosphate transferase
MTGLATHFLVALGLSLAVTPLCRALAHRLGYVARPKEDRWHTRPTALLGGMAIVVSTLAVAIVSDGLSARLWQLIACSTAIAVFGLADDILSLKASTKLIAQITVASALLFFGYRIGWTSSLVLDAMLTLFWIVGVTNALNLLDNMDGLCGGIALIAGAFLLIGLGREPAESSAALYLATLLGATAGFVVYNVHPASIFMGDAGSLFIGFNLAALTLLGRPEEHGRAGVLSVVAAPVFLLLIPILDTTLVTVARLMSGRRPSQGGRDHSSHRLVAVGLSESRAVATLWALAAAGGVISVIVQRPDKSWPFIVALTFVLAMIIFAVYLARIRVYQEADPALVGGTVTPLVANFMYKRRVAEVLLDLCLIPLAYYTAYRLRFEGSLLAASYPLFLQSLPVVLGSQLMALFVVGGYRGTWRYFGMMDAVVFAKGVLLGTVGSELVILYVYRFESYSRSVFIIYGVLLFLLLVVTRGSFRLMGEFIHRRRSTGLRCAVYGTGGASLATIHEAFGDAPLKIVGFIDDNPSARRTRVGGYSVLGGFDVLLELVTSGQVDCVVLNTHLLEAARLQELEHACREAEIELLRLHVDLKPLSAVS